MCPSAPQVRRQGWRHEASQPQVLAEDDAQAGAPAMTGLVVVLHHHAAEMELWDSRVGVVGVTVLVAAVEVAVMVVV